MGRTQAVYYRDRERGEPVLAFLERQPAAARAALDTLIGVVSGLDAGAPPPPYPVTSQVSGELRELRGRHGRTRYRILYRRTGNLIVLLHAFEKRTPRIPAREIAIAEARWLDLRSRMEAGARRSSRPIGGDAP